MILRGKRKNSLKIKRANWFNRIEIKPVVNLSIKYTRRILVALVKALNIRRMTIYLLENGIWGIRKTIEINWVGSKT